MVAHADNIDARIRELHAAGLLDWEIAELVGRWRQTVTVRRNRLGLPSNDSRCRMWTVKEQRRAMELALAGQRHKDIAAILGRTVRSIDNMLSKIGGGELNYRLSVSEHRRSLAWDMLAAGHKIDEISSRLGVCSRAVRRYRQEMPDWWAASQSRESGELA